MQQYVDLFYTVFVTQNFSTSKLSLCLDTKQSNCPMKDAVGEVSCRGWYPAPLFLP